MNNQQTNKEIEEIVEEAMKEIGKRLSNGKGCSTDFGAWLYPVSDVEDILRQALLSHEKAVEERVRGELVKALEMSKDKFSCALVVPESEIPNMIIFNQGGIAGIESAIQVIKEV